MIRILFYILLFLPYVEAGCQEKWTVEQCIRYAVAHNHDVRKYALDVDDSKSERMRAIGAMLPYVEAGVGARYNFGRSTDPETNITTDVNTFNNDYGISASLPVFDGLQRYNDLKAARASVLMGRQGFKARKDAVAQQVFHSFIDVLYYQGTLAFAKEKREESRMLLHRTKVMEEIGTKGEADVAQMDAVLASDDYEVARQQGLLSAAMHTLKQHMNYPVGDELEIDTVLNDDIEPLLESTQQIFDIARDINPEVKVAEYSLMAAKYQYRSSIGALMPSISIHGGVSTNYYRHLGSEAKPFSQQFRDHVGKYVYATVSVPLFDGMYNVSRIRRFRNNMLKAREDLDFRSKELQRLIDETVIECNNGSMEVKKMLRKVEADSIATRLTVRKYEEGLASSIDVQSSRITLIQSRALLLQCQLTYCYKKRILNYYKGTDLWTE